MTGRPVTPRGQARHTPLRPTWLCRTCAAPWPCGTAKLTLLAAHPGDHLGLTIRLAARLHEALYDLAELHGPDAPSPQALNSRFLGWITRPRREPRA